MKTWKWMITLLCAVSLTLALGACGDDSDDEGGENNAVNNDTPNNDTPNNDAPNNDVETLTFDDVQPIFVANCGGAGCHLDGSKSGGLALDTLADVEAGGFNGPSIEACDSENSVLIQKLLDPPPFASRMPLARAPLSDADIQKLSDWVNTGSDVCP